MIEAAGTKPFGFMPFYPGPGLRGHCIPIDPFLLLAGGSFDVNKRSSVELAGRRNVGTPDYAFNRITAAPELPETGGQRV